MQGPPCQRCGSGAKDQHNPASAAVNSVDHVIELIAQIRIVREKTQSMGAFDRYDLQLLRDIATEHDPIFSQPSAGVDRARRQHFNTLDRAYDFRSIDDIRYDRERGCRPRGDGLCKLDLHGRSSDRLSRSKIMNLEPRGVSRP
jgi:hypothetical protein